MTVLIHLFNIKRVSGVSLQDYHHVSWQRAQHRCLWRQQAGEWRWFPVWLLIPSLFPDWLTVSVWTFRSDQKWSFTVCFNMLEPPKRFSPWRRYCEALPPSMSAAPFISHPTTVIPPYRWCSTWASTSSRSSCMIRSSSTSSTAPTMNWAGFWESTASPSKSRGEISLSSDVPMKFQRQRKDNKLCFCFRVLFATIMKNLVAVKNQGGNIFSSSSCCSSESSSQTIIHNPVFCFLCFFFFFQIHRARVIQIQTNSQRSRRWEHSSRTTRAHTPTLLSFMEAEFVIPGGSRRPFSRQEEQATEEEEELQEQRPRWTSSPC